MINTFYHVAHRTVRGGKQSGSSCCSGRVGHVPGAVHQPPGLAAAGWFSLIKQGSACHSRSRRAWRQDQHILLVLASGTQSCQLPCGVAQTVLLQGQEQLRNFCSRTKVGRDGFLLLTWEAVHGSKPNARSNPCRYRTLGDNITSKTEGTKPGCFLSWPLRVPDGPATWRSMVRESKCYVQWLGRTHCHHL